MYFIIYQQHKALDNHVYNNYQVYIYIPMDIHLHTLIYHPNYQVHNYHHYSLLYISFMNIILYNIYIQYFQ